MTLFSYEIFDAVARQGSFNKAAQQLHLTPSAISHAIAVMEAELGFTLFNRGKNGVTMTSYGASLYPSIRDVLNSDEALKQSIARLNGLEKGKVKLGVFNSVCASLLPGLLKSFMTHYPQIEIEVYQGTYDDVKEWLRTGQVDIAFLSSTCREEFNLTELFREPLLCIVPQDWPEPENGVMTPALMNGQSFVVQCDATDAEMRQFLKKYKIGTERRCHVIDDQSNIAMVEAGLGISIMPQMLLRDCKAAIKIYPIEPEEDRVVGLAVQRPAAMAPAPAMPARANHFKPVPPTNISTAPMPKISSVPDRCGSSSISTVTAPRITIKGSTPVAKVCILSWLREMMWANTSTTANLAISLGCKVPSPGSTIHRLQPLYSGMNSTIASNASDTPMIGHASLCQMW